MFSPMTAFDDQDHELLQQPLRPRRNRTLWPVVAILGILASACIFSVSHHGNRDTKVERSSVDRAFLSEALIEAVQSTPSPANAAVVEDESANSLAPKKQRGAEDLLDNAVSLSKKADSLDEDAHKLSDKSSILVKDAEALKSEAKKEENDVSSKRAKAEELRKKADEMRKQASDLVQEATTLDGEAGKKSDSATQKTHKAQDLAHKSESKKKSALDDRKHAGHAQEEAWKAIAGQRMCIRLPGVKLKGTRPNTFQPVVGNHTIQDEWQCSDWCQKNVKCKQAVYTWETKTCELFEEATAEPLGFRDRWPFFNSTYCGALDEKTNMLDMLHKVYERKPWVEPPHNCSWAGDNCLNTGCCADVAKADWQFTEFQDYTCFKRDENWAGCKTGGPPADWDGANLGGHPNHEVKPAPEGKLVQGTKLYCFTVVMWDQPPAEGWMNSEAELVNHWKEQGKGICQCDDWSLFDGIGGGSVHNIQSFIHAWKLVQDDGRWKNNDWSIKVDGDAVFFPEHLRQKIMWSYRTPQGSAVYLRNTFYKFKFLGALEALTREALEVYFEHGWECEAHLGQQGGEDYWLEQCLEGLGIDFQTDESLLHDKYASDGNCNDPYGVAHHFFKKIEGGDGWDVCWDQANNAWNGAHKDS